MADVNANIDINIDSSNAISQLKSLQRQISQFHTSIAKSSETAALAQRGLEKNLLNSINSIGAFSAELRTVRTTAESFTNSLEKNKFSMREYFRYAGASTKTFGKLFRSEFDTIEKVATDRVKRLQTQYIKLGRDTNGAMKAMAVIPNQLDMSDYGTKVQIAAQKQALFNQLMKQGSTNLLNFGKNTQWAGRQLMVGFTIPLSIVGSAASKTFMEMEAQALKFKKVYGDLFTPQAETQAALDNVTELGKQFTKYGISVSQTVGLAAEAAAAGFQGLDLQRQTTEATRLSVLGQIDSAKALETTISLQNAFGMSSEKLASSIDFLNAVENQTVVSLDDITTAIPKVAPVIQQLGGDVKDLTFFLAAMKEGGINASEGANALKSGLAALINPTAKASAMLAQFGINANDIVTKNKGNLKATVVEFAQALNQLDPLNRAQAIEQMFGKFQFARLSTLFANVAKDGNQAARVLDLANSSVEQLSSLSEKELGMTADSSMNKFKKSVEDLKIALVPVGKAFLEAVTPIVEFVGNILDKFNNLSAGSKKAITLLVTVIGGLGPVLLMTFGLLANGVANIIKLFLTLRQGYQRLTGQSQILGEQTQYLTMEQLDATAVAHSLNQAHATLTQQFTLEAGALSKLVAAYQQAAVAGQNFALRNPGAMVPRSKGFADGVVSVPGSGNKDTVPAMLTPGEAVIPKDMVKKYGPLINGMVAGNIPGYADGLKVAGVSAPAGTQFGHITTTIETTVDAFLGSLKMMSQDMQEQHRSTIHYLQQISELGLGAKKLTTYSGLGAFQGEALNEALGKGGRQVPKEMILKDMTDLGMQRWEPALAIGETKLKDVSQELMDYENALRDGILDFENMHGKTTMSGQELEALEKSIRETLPASSKLKQALDLAADTITEFRLSLNKADLAMVGQNFPEAIVPAIPGEKSSGGINITGVSGKTRKIRGKGDNLKARVPGGMGRYSAIAASQAEEVANEVILATSRAAGTQSPSKKTIPIGEDVARGLEIGMQNRQDDVSRVGTSLGETAVTATQSGARTRRGAVRAQGAPGEVSAVKLSQINPPINQDVKTKTIENTRVLQSSTERLSKFNNLLMGGSFALTSLAGAGSMAGGFIGDLSQQIFKFSGLLFGLMSITQLLTQAKIAELAVSRASSVGLLVGNVATKKMAFNSSLFTGGIKKLLPNLLNFGKLIGRFLGPIGLVISGLLAAKGIIDLVNKAREKERLAIEGVGKAANITEGQLKKLGELYGFVPTQTKFSITPTVAGVVGQQRTKVEETKQLYRDDKEFQKNVTTLKNASVKEADLIFKTMALRLLGAGATQEAIQNIIIALQEEAGRTELKFNFKGIDLNTEEGKTNFKKSIDDVLGTFSKDFQKGFKEVSGTISRRGYSEAFKNQNLSNDLKKSLSTASNVLAADLESLKGQLANGTINAKTFAESFDLISLKMKQMSEPAALFLLSETLKTLNPDLQTSVNKLKDINDKMIILQALAIGLKIEAKQIDALNAGGAAGATVREDILKQITDRINQTATAAAAAKKEYENLNSTTSEKSPKQAIQERTKALLDQAKAYTTLRAKGYDAATAAELAGDSLIAAAIASGKVKVGTKEWQNLINKLKDAQLQADTVSARLSLEQQSQDIKVQLDAYAKLIKAGFDAKKAAELVNDVNLAKLILNTKKAKMTFAELVKAINAAQLQADKLKNLGDPFGSTVSKIQPMMDKFNSNHELMMEKFRIQEERAKQQFQPAIDAAEKAVQAIQDNIDNTNSKFSKLLDPLALESTVLSNTLSIIDNKSQTINEKYDAQAEALQKISDINSDIAAQQQKQLSLADALSSGDISAAAAAAQEMRTAAAARATGAQSGTLEAARKSELDSIKVNGMTRLDIEKRQYAISQLQYSLEQQRDALLRVYNAQLESANITLKNAQLALDTALKTISDQRTAWENAKLAIDEAENSVRTMNITLAEQLSLVQQIIAAWNAAAAAQAAASSIPAPGDGGAGGGDGGTGGGDGAGVGTGGGGGGPLTTAGNPPGSTGGNIFTTPMTISGQSIIPSKSGSTGATLASAFSPGSLISRGVSAIGSAVKNLATTAVSKATTAVKNVATSIANTAKNVISNPISALKSAAVSVAQRVAAPVLGPIKAISNVASGVKKLFGFSQGGLVPRYMANGGSVGSDTIPAMLSPGEFVMNRSATKQFGPELAAMNNSKYPSMLKNMSAATYPSIQSSNVSPTITAVSTNVSDNSSTMYNYNIGITVPQSNANSNDIARAVIGQIKYIDSQRIRGQK